MKRLSPVSSSCLAGPGLVVSLGLEPRHHRPAQSIRTGLDPAPPVSGRTQRITQGPSSPHLEAAALSPTGGPKWPCTHGR